MRHLTSLLVLLALDFVPAAAQSDINASILEFTEEFKMSSPTSGTDKVHKTITVFNEEGLSSAQFVVFTDSFRSLGSFGGEIVEPNGKKTKLSKKFLSNTSLSVGLADDYSVVHYTPVFNYPFTVTYDYSVEYHDGIVMFPPFMPLTEENVSLMSASYTLTVPRNTDISKYDKNLEYTFEFDAKKDTHKWTTGEVKPVIGEHLMKLDPKALPLLMAEPVDFSYGGTTGRQSDWKELGAWINSLGVKADDLPESEIAKVREMTADAKTEYETIHRLYTYLRDKTRYVSIQLGIGGYRTLPASHVVKTGFGDCKALSNYMKSLLKAAGIDSYYYVIHTDRKDFFGNLPNPGQMNHAMLAVPLKENGDTLFVECTNPTYPLGYRHSDCAGHEILLISEEGGQKVRVGGYPDSLSMKIREARIVLREDGSARISIKDKRKLDYAETFIDFASIDPEKQVRYLVSDWLLQPENAKIEGISNNFNDYPIYGRNFIPEAEVDFSMDCRTYANKNGERIFFPMNPLAKVIFSQRSARINRIYSEDAGTLIDRYSVVIPDGYKIESVPDNATIDTVWGTFTSLTEVDAADDHVLHITQILKGKPFDEDKSQYPSYKEFARKINKLYASKVVIVRK